MRLGIKLSSGMRGSSLTIVVLAVAIFLIASVGFLQRSSIFQAISNLRFDVLDSAYQRDSALETARARLQRAVRGMRLEAKLEYVGGPTPETFNNLSNTYAVDADTALEFLRDVVETQAMNGSGVVDSSSEFADFDDIFHGSVSNGVYVGNWFDSDASDGEQVELKYTITPQTPIVDVNPPRISFTYDVEISGRGYGRAKFSKSESVEVFSFTVDVLGAPFSRWALFMNSMSNQNGGILTFAGGDTSSQAQEFYGGPVHVNLTPYFYGHPAFMELFTSSIAEGSWQYFSATNYTGCPGQCPTFSNGYQGSVSTITLPTQIFNTTRLAAGDTSTTASTNNTAVTDAELVSFLAYHANGSLGAVGTPPAGIYVPVDGSGSTTPSGGIYVQGDANIVLNVVQGASDFTASEWAQISAGDQACKFQKFAISSPTSAFTARTILVADDPCESTYVLNTASPATAPAVLTGRPNGNLHVNGMINELGGASRTRPAVAQDFAYTISATKDVRIINDLQYEDAEYVTISGSTLGTTVVATPTGEVGGSGKSPSDTDVAAQIDSDSRTMLGIMSTQRNVMIHLNAPANINLHATLFAGNSAAYDSATGYGCGSGVNIGCGFGFEGWNSETGRGNLKLLGTIAQYRSQTLGVLSSPAKGYASRYLYDSRLLQSVMPPAFPISDSPEIYTTIHKTKTWRLSRVDE